MRDANGADSKEMLQVSDTPTVTFDQITRKWCKMLKTWQAITIGTDLCFPCRLRKRQKCLKVYFIRNDGLFYYVSTSLLSLIKLVPFLRKVYRVSKGDVSDIIAIVNFLFRRGLRGLKQPRFPILNLPRIYLKRIYGVGYWSYHS